MMPRLVTASDDALDEINLAADRIGSSKRIRAGQRHFVRIRQRMRQRPLWLKQLKNHQRTRPRAS